MEEPKPKVLTKAEHDELFQTPSRRLRRAQGQRSARTAPSGPPQRRSVPRAGARELFNNRHVAVEQVGDDEYVETPCACFQMRPHAIEDTLYA